MKYWRILGLDCSGTWRVVLLKRQTEQEAIEYLRQYGWTKLKTIEIN